MSPGKIRLFQLALCVGALKIRLVLIENILVRTRVDDEQDVTRLDQLPVLETDLVGRLLLFGERPIAARPR